MSSARHYGYLSAVWKGDRHHKKVGTQATNWEKIFATHATNKRLVFRIYHGEFSGGPVVETLGFHCREHGQGTKIPHVVWHGQQTNKSNNQNNPQNNNSIYHEFLWISKEKTNGPVEKWAMIGASILQRRNKWSIKRRCLTSLIIRKMQIRPQWESSRMCITGNTYVTADTFLYQQNISILFSSWTWAYPVTQHLRKHWPEGRSISIVAWVTCNLCPGTLVGKLNSRTVILRNKNTKLKPGGCEMNSVDLPAK